MCRRNLLVSIAIFSIVALNGCFTVKQINVGDPSGNSPSAVREFRAAWVATVANINWPSSPGLSVAEQREEAIRLLELLRENNFNAVIFQVRPQCDALYLSELEPWSYYLTGEQGIAPDPYYDPLELWIEEAHKRGLELHAWLNPYRAHHVSGGPLTESSIVKRKPELAVFLERGYWWLDPSLKATQDHSYQVVMDLVRRYDLDGIHFDDYFYPYPDYNNFKDFPDDSSWNKYLQSGGKLSRGDWRRKSVDDFIERVYKGIKAEKPYVKFGLSPFGIWRPNNPPSISGFDQYEVLYADARKWLNEGWVDYYSPQLYWPISRINLSYPVLLGWWSGENKKDRHLWPGISTGSLRGEEGINEAIDQIMVTRGMVPDSPGVVHWSIGSMVSNPMLAEALAEGPYREQALVPSSPWLSSNLPDLPRVRSEKIGDSLKIDWTHKDKDEIARWLIYKKYGSAWEYMVCGNRADSILIPLFEIDKEALLSMDPESPYKLSDIITPLDSIGLSVVDRYGNESPVIRQAVTGINLVGAPSLDSLRAAYFASTITPYSLDKPDEKLFEIKEFHLVSDILLSDDEDGIKSEVDILVEQALEEGSNSLFLNTSNISTKVPGAIEYAVEAAKCSGLKIFIVIDPVPVKTELGLPGLKKALKEDVKNNVSKYNIDGLCFDLKDVDNRIALNSEMIGDLLEDAVVEAMLIKPYLLPAIINNDGSVSPYKNEKVHPGQAAGLNFADYFNGDGAGQSIYLLDERRSKITDSDGAIGFITDVKDTLRLETSRGKLLLPLEHWALPYKYAVFQGDSVSRITPWLEFRKMPPGYTSVPEFDLLCKSEYPARVMINGEQVKQYKTGIFFKTIKLSEGVNRIRATILTDDSLTAFYEREFIYTDSDQKRPQFPLWIDVSSLKPDYDMELMQEDVLQFSFHGSSGMEANVKIFPGNIKLKCSAIDHNGYSLYRAEIPLSSMTSGQKYRVLMQLSEPGSILRKDVHEKFSPFSIQVKKKDQFPLVRVCKRNCRLTYNLGAPRLGGPLRSEPPVGTVFKVSGRFGDKYRVALNDSESGFLSVDDVELLPGETVSPSYYITNMSCGPSAGGDILSIPYPEPVPWEIHPDPSGKKLTITLFGVNTSSTWISHYAGLKVIDRVEWEQSNTGTYRVIINLKSARIWGYKSTVEGGRLVLRLKYPPAINPESKKPLSGLRIAIEAGHGGQSTGAIGLSGLLEKDINLDVSLRLGEICKAMGAEVIQVREKDEDMLLSEKRDIVIDSGADIFISVHANAGGTGYLQVDGTSTYYNNPFWAPLAESIYAELLKLGLDEFGVVGSFNYTPIRMSEMPAILVEQAFMSHAEDEEKLADMVFRQSIAEKIADGIVKYLREVHTF